MISGAIREKLTELGTLPYSFQPFNKDESLDYWNYRTTPEANNLLLEDFDYLCQKLSSFKFPYVPGNIGEGKYCSYSELEEITDFKHDLIQMTQLGRLFRGTITEGFEKRPVIVKTWDLLLPSSLEHDRRQLQFCDEIELYETAIAHKYLAKLSCYCYERRLAVVYDEIYSVLLSDVLLADYFGWDKRINVATQLAELLAWLHEKRIAISSVTASCIMIDKEMNDIKVFDFGCIYHGVIEDSEIPLGRLVGRDAPEVFSKGVRTMKSDVYVFGLLLMELINKREIVSLPRDDSIVIEAKRGGESFVHECFQEVDNQTASAITELTSRCLSLQPEKRPTMTEVFNDLGKLRKGVEVAGGENPKEEEEEEEEVRGGNQKSKSQQKKEAKKNFKMSRRKYN